MCGGSLWGTMPPVQTTGPEVLRCIIGCTGQGPLCRKETIRGLMARLLTQAPGPLCRPKARPAPSPTGFTNSLYMSTCNGGGLMRSPRRSGTPWGPESTPWWSLKSLLPKKGPICTLGATYYMALSCSTCCSACCLCISAVCMLPSSCRAAWCCCSRCRTSARTLSRAMVFSSSSRCL